MPHHPFELSPADASRRRQLRRALRQQRRDLSPALRQRASRRLAKRANHQLPCRRLQHIAIYSPMDGEIDPRSLTALPRFRHTRFYYPKLPLLAGETLRFMPMSGMRSRNRFGIEEPRRYGHGRPIWALDAVLLPAVGFDRAGHRLGMGGGFYDRTLATLQRRPRKPVLCVVGYAFQCLEIGALTLAPWDQPADLVITGEVW